MNVLSAATSPNSVINKEVTQEKVIKQPIEQPKKVEYKPDILDVFSKKVVNQRDITDTVTVPRAIFKGYLCFTVGTAINSIASLLKHEKLKKGLTIAGTLASIYGTYNFVKSFLIKENNWRNKKNKLSYY